MKKMKKSTAVVAFSFLVASLVAAPVSAHGADDSTITIPITFTSNEVVTAADFEFQVANASIAEINCGGDGFSELIKDESGCVVFHPSGGETEGTLATLSLTVDAHEGGMESKPEVGIVATLSTVDGVEPSTYEVLAGEYTVTPVVTPSPTLVATADTTDDSEDNGAILLMVVVGLVLILAGAIGYYVFSNPDTTPVQEPKQKS